MTREARMIRPFNDVQCVINLPPSKSYTNRALIAAALASGPSLITNPSTSDDSAYLISALREFGVKMDVSPRCIELEGTNGIFSAPEKELFVGNAGTTLRFLTSFASLAIGTTLITGDAMMRQRPVEHLLESLRGTGVRCTSRDGYPPIVIHGGTFSGGTIEMNGSVSSQFVSSLLLSSPYAAHPVHLSIKGALRSRPYIDMTIHVMRSFGALVDQPGDAGYVVSNSNRYVGTNFTVEADAASATYFAAAAAVTGGKITLANLPQESLQGDVRFFELLSRMGCQVQREEKGIAILGGRLAGITADMNDIPDCVPALAVVALFADGPTELLNVGHLRFKETDRVQALGAGLTRLGAKVDIGAENILIVPGTPGGQTIETYDDHRMAMSFAVAGLRIPGVIIENAGCVSKSFPNFWAEFTKLEQSE